MEHYYFRHKLDQERYAFLQVEETNKDSFLFIFRLRDTNPASFIRGSIFENVETISSFREAANMMKEAETVTGFDWWIMTDSETIQDLQMMVENFKTMLNLK